MLIPQLCHTVSLVCGKYKIIPLSDRGSSTSTTCPESFHDSKINRNQTQSQVLHHQFPSMVCKLLHKVVLCEYSKFRIESNSYLLFDSIRNWRNYSKFSNTHSVVISRAIETRFACTLPVTSPCTHLSVEPSAAPCVCTYPSHSADHRMGAAAGGSLDRDTWSRYNSGRQTQRTVSWALDFLSVLLWIQL